MSYEINFHNADIRLKALGDNEEDLFLSLLSGLNKSINPVLEKRGLLEEKEITIEALDLGNLLVDFLNEIISLSYSSKEIYSFKNIRIFRNDEFILEAILIPKKAVKFNRKIKSALYKDLSVIQKPDNRFEAVVMFDI